MRDYELVVLLHPDLEIDLDKPLKKIEKTITGLQGTIVTQDIWGKRKLAYPIKKEEFAVYVYFEIQLPPTSVKKVDAALNITDEVLRHLLTNPVPKPEQSEETDKVAESKSEASEETADKAKAKSTKLKAKGGK